MVTTFLNTETQTMKYDKIPIHQLAWWLVFCSDFLLMQHTGNLMIYDLSLSNHLKLQWTSLGYLCPGFKVLVWPAHMAIWLHFGCSANKPFSASHSHITIFYYVTENQHLLPVFVKIAPIEQHWFNNNHCCKNYCKIRLVGDLIYGHHKLQPWWAGSVAVVSQGLPTHQFHVSLISW